MTEITLQWRPEHGPQRKLTFEQTETNWIRIETVWEGTQWRETGTERVQNLTVHAPDLDTEPTIESLCMEIHDTWNTPNPKVLYFDTTEPIVVAARNTALRYYSGKSTGWHPIDETGLHHLIRNHGLPTVTALTETPYSRTQLERGVIDE